MPTVTQIPQSPRCKAGCLICNHYNYAEGNSSFSDVMCWFSHNEGQDQGNTPEYKCDLCNKVIKGRFDFIKHRKLEQAVPKCMFGEDNCGFLHETDKNEKNDSK